MCVRLVDQTNVYFYFLAFNFDENILIRLDSDNFARPAQRSSGWFSQIFIKNKPSNNSFLVSQLWGIIFQDKVVNLFFKHKFKKRKKGNLVKRKMNSKIENEKQ